MENKLFTEEKISIAYIRLAMPLVMSMVVSLVYNLADTFFVAQTQQHSSGGRRLPGRADLYAADGLR